MSILVAPQPQAQELLLSDAYALVRDGDVEAVEQAFERHQDAFNRNLISAGNYVTPYDVFLTTDPRVVALTDAWLDAMPDSPQALVAKATFLSHVALIIRGADIVWDTPANSMLRMRQLYDRALPLFQRALELEPRHLFAARTLGNLARYAGDREGRELADGIDRSLSGPRYSFYQDLHWLQPGWGGSEAAMREACDEGAATLPSVSAEECHAVVTLELATAPPKDLLDAARTLEAIDPSRWVVLRAGAFLAIDRAADATALYEANNVPMHPEFVAAIGRKLRDPTVIRRLSIYALSLDPLHPGHLANLALALDLQGKYAEALEKADAAMKYGETIPFVRIARMWVMSRDADRQWDLLSEFEDAVADTNAHYEVMLKVTAALVAPTESMSHKRDGTPIEDFECRRLRIFAINLASCEVPGTKTGNCLPEIRAKYFEPALDEALRSGMCRDANTTTWSELMEEWLTLPVPPPI